MERAFCEELGRNLLFRWFLGMQLMKLSFDPVIRSRRRRRRIRSQAEDTTGQRAIHSWVKATGAPFLARELYFPDQLEDSAAK